MSAKETSRAQEIRCLKCFSRFTPDPGSERAFCPGCEMEWRISWLNPDTPKIRGPVWEQNSAETD